jgi:hypothetical protein
MRRRTGQQAQLLAMYNLLASKWSMLGTLTARTTLELPLHQMVRIRMEQDARDEHDSDLERFRQTGDGTCTLYVFYVTLYETLANAVLSLKVLGQSSDAVRTRLDTVLASAAGCGNLLGCMCDADTIIQAAKDGLPALADAIGDLTSGLPGVAALLKAAAWAGTAYANVNRRAMVNHALEVVAPFDVGEAHGNGTARALEWVAREVARAVGASLSRDDWTALANAAQDGWFKRTARQMMARYSGHRDINAARDQAYAFRDGILAALLSCSPTDAAGIGGDRERLCSHVFVQLGLHRTARERRSESEHHPRPHPLALPPPLTIPVPARDASGSGGGASTGGASESANANAPVSSTSSWASLSPSASAVLSREETERLVREEVRAALREERDRNQAGAPDVRRGGGGASGHGPQVLLQQQEQRTDNDHPAGPAGGGGMMLDLDMVHRRLDRVERGLAMQGRVLDRLCETIQNEDMSDILDAVMRDEAPAPAADRAALIPPPAALGTHNLNDGSLL